MDIEQLFEKIENKHQPHFLQEIVEIYCDSELIIVENLLMFNVC